MKNCGKVFRKLLMTTYNNYAMPQRTISDDHFRTTDRISSEWDLVISLDWLPPLLALFLWFMIF